tara:strand:- start:687 stop:1004 length:318 start_codon:yes stop_codon:yes gene_type:complete
MQVLKKILDKIPDILKNIYVLTIILFFFWIIFIDDYNLINQKKIQNKIDDLKKQEEFYLSEIKKDSIELKKLKNSTDYQEKFAREKFLMKKDNEDLFIIRNKNDE